MADDDYEIVPEKELDSLKSDVERLKNEPIANTPEGKSLKASIDMLNGSINNLFNLFRITADSIKAESGENEVKQLAKKIEELTEQNEKIAGGIISLADMVEELKNKSETPSIAQPSPQRASQASFGGIPSSQPGPGGPPPGMDSAQPFGPPTPGSQPLPRTDVPQMPHPPAQKKRSLFGLGN